MATTVTAIGNILGSINVPTSTSAYSAEEEETQNEQGSAAFCPACKGSGMITRRDENGYTVSAPCRVCNALHKKYVRLLLEKAELPYHTMDVRPHDETFDFIKNFDATKPHWIVYSGKAGSGKTTESAWLAYQLICKKHVRTSFLSTDEVIRKLLATRNRQTEHEELIESLKDVDLIVLDDFLKGMPARTSYRFAEYMEACFSLVWTRYDVRKPLVLTTQVPLRMLPQIDAALAGRIFEMSKGHMVQYGEDARNWRTR